MIMRAMKVQTWLMLPFEIVDGGMMGSVYTALPVNEEGILICLLNGLVFLVFQVSDRAAGWAGAERGGAGRSR